MTTAEGLKALLDARWPEDKGWLAVDELADAPGFSARQRVDWAAIGVWGGNAFYLVSAEIKVHRSDWLRELGQPTKNREHVAESNEFWYVAPDRSIIDPKEVPEGRGLLLLQGERLVAKVRPKPSSGEPSPAILTAFFRAVVRHRRRERELVRRFAEFQGRTIGIDDLRNLARKLGYLHERQRAATEEHGARRRTATEWARAVSAVRRLAETLVPYELRSDHAKTTQLIVDACSTIQRIADVGRFAGLLGDRIEEAGRAIERMCAAAKDTEA